MQFRTLVLFATCVIAPRIASQDPPVLGPLRCAMKRDYWLQRPSGFDASRTHWLVVLAHGFRAEGKDILWLRRSLAQFDDCIVVAPSFPEGFQLLEARTDQQLIGLFASLKKNEGEPGPGPGEPASIGPGVQNAVGIVGESSFRNLQKQILPKRNCLVILVGSHFQI